MNLEQEKSPNNLEQPSFNGVEAFETPENKTEITSLPTPEDLAEEIELSVEPQFSQITTEIATSPLVTVQNWGEKALELFVLSEDKINDDAGNANKIVERFNEYKESV